MIPAATSLIPPQGLAFADPKAWSAICNSPTWHRQTSASQPPVLCLLKLPYFPAPTHSPLKPRSLFLLQNHSYMHLRESSIVHLCIQPCLKTRHYTYHGGLLEPLPTHPPPLACGIHSPQFSVPHSFAYLLFFDWAE